MSKVANAVLALSRAFYGKRLSEKQYNDLLSCKSMNEIASYLRTRTAYGESFGGVQPTEYTSGILEDIIFRHKFDYFDSLCRFELAIGNNFYKYFIVQTEIDQILKCTLFILGGNTEGYLMQLSDFLSRHLSIDLYALGCANTLEDVAAAIANTPYEKIYRRCLDTPHRSYLTFEFAFDSYFESFQSELINRCFKGDEKKSMREMICHSFDKLFIEKQYRIVKYYSGNLEVTNLVAPNDISMTLFSEHQIKDIVSCRTEQEFIELIGKTAYKDCVAGENRNNIEKAIYLNFYNYCRKKIRFSSHPGVVMYAYLFLAQAEADNIVRIIEGVKYDIPLEEIKNSLVVS
ncbi:MAG: V-type ATPase subunit [Faecalibacterium sp.]|nr:V-type ATPase subunit [Ruminococcus sp.]MCM1392625.1 V-type ATPase subunit [Ruminococcus sp.]MCM1486068.1 V-type ATPase subunit [Faecalibacterium sp.]